MGTNQTVRWTQLERSKTHVVFLKPYDKPKREANIKARKRAGLTVGAPLFDKNHRVGEKQTQEKVDDDDDDAVDESCR